MWNEVSKPGGIEVFVEWFAQMFANNGESALVLFSSHPDEVFLYRDTIETLHKVSLAEGKAN